MSQKQKSSSVLPTHLTSDKHNDDILHEAVSEKKDNPV